MRWIVAALLLSTAAQAQTPMTGPSAAPTEETPAFSAPSVIAPPSTDPNTLHHAHRNLQERFAAANTTHDGHLTLEQARSKMPSVARDFAAIDTERKGYVTVDQIKAHAAAARAARRAAKEKN